MIDGKRLAIGAALAALVGLMLGASNARAGCDPHNYDSGRTDNFQHVYWNGWRRPKDNMGNTAFDWIKADIDAQSPFNMQTPNCSGKSCDASYVWIMLADPTLNYWAQIGPATLHDGNRYNFVQCSTASNGVSNAYLGASTAGTQPTYEVQDLGGSSGIELEVLGQHYDFCTNANFTVGRAISASEIHTRGDQVPGNQGNHDNLDTMKVHFGGATYDYLSNGDHYKETGSDSAAWDKLTYDQTSNTHMETWDDDCP